MDKLYAKYKKMKERKRGQENKQVLPNKRNITISYLGFFLTMTNFGPDFFVK